MQSQKTNTFFGKIKISYNLRQFEKQILNESSDLLYLHSHKLKLEKEIELKKKELEDLS